MWHHGSSLKRVEQLAEPVSGATARYAEPVSEISVPRLMTPPAEVRELGPLVVVEDRCPYLGDDRITRTAFALPGTLSPPAYQRAMEIGMRRSGAIVYRPVCEGCRKCQPLRVPVRDFVPSRSQRRVHKRCHGLFEVSVGASELDDERLALYERYLAFQHPGGGQTADRESYVRALVESITETVELTFRDEDGRLVGVSILDVTPDSLSSVYFYWEPELAKLSLGVYSALVEIELCREWNKAYYYLGYVVADCRPMRYKASFAGAEVWSGRSWVRLPGRDTQAPAVLRVLQQAEQAAMLADAQRFRPYETDD